MNCLGNAVSSSLECWKKGEGKRECGARAACHRVVFPSADRESLGRGEIAGSAWTSCAGDRELGIAAAAGTIALGLLSQCLCEVGFALERCCREQRAE